jgi:hypothetical protein
MARLDRAELKYVKDLLYWNTHKRAGEVFLNNLMLFLGGVIIIISIYMTLLKLSDTVIWTILPGFLAGILFIWIYMVGKRRIKERHLLSNLLNKLLSKTDDTE